MGDIMKKGAIFDMDGLLLDTERLYQHAWVEVAKLMGFTPNPDFTEAICGTNGQTAYNVITKFYPKADPVEFWDTGVDWVRNELKRSVPKFPGVDEILSFLHGHGIKMAVASSSDRDMIESNMHQAELDQYFEAIVSGSEVECGKPKPDIFLEAAKRIGIPADECYVFEDGINGARAGIAAGCMTVMIPDLVQPTDDLRESCTAICSSLYEALELLRQDRI